MWTAIIHEGRLHHFAMLPYGMIRYRGAPAELRDIPIGTVLYGRFYLPPDPKTSAVPNVKGNRRDRSRARTTRFCWRTARACVCAKARPGS